MSEIGNSALPFFKYAIWDEGKILKIKTAEEVKNLEISHTDREGIPLPITDFKIFPLNQ